MTYFSDTWKFMKTYVIQHYKAIIIGGILIYPLLMLLSTISPWFIHVETSDVDFNARDMFTFISLGTVFTVNILILTGYHLRSSIGDRRVFTSMPLMMASKLTGTFLLGLIWCIWNIIIYFALALTYALIKFGRSDMNIGEVDFRYLWAVLFGIFAYLAVIVFYKLVEKKGFYNFILFLGTAALIVFAGHIYRAVYFAISGMQVTSLACVTWHLFTIGAVFTGLSALALKFNMYKEG